MNIRFEFLWTDILLYLVAVLLLIIFLISLRRPNVRSCWHNVFQRPIAMIAFLVLINFFGIALLDSIHYHRLLPRHSNHQLHYSPETYSLLDKLMAPIGIRHEKTYAAPFSFKLYAREFITDSQGITHSDYPKLQYISTQPIRQLILIGLLKGLIICFIPVGILAIAKFKVHKSIIAWKTACLTILIIIMLSSVVLTLAAHYYILGTDKVGQDVFYLTVKSIRTGLIIGTITTMSMLPFALFLGVIAGYFGGTIDTIIQYIYTTISSIPGVLLITATILSMQIFIAAHPQYFSSLAQMADARLLALCIILGFTSWTSLCRLLRAETLKIRESDYMQAATALGSSMTTIIFRHIIPNVMHIILITTVLDFSFLILAEAVLSYVGVGVSPLTISWGNMINSARLELAREPIVWWPMFAAFCFMFVLVLSGNVFADAVRDAFDPRAKK